VPQIITIMIIPIKGRKKIPSINYFLPDKPGHGTTDQTLLVDIPLQQSTKTLAPTPCNGITIPYVIRGNSRAIMPPITKADAKLAAETMAETFQPNSLASMLIVAMQGR
jgi:hypothetical protein